MNSPGEPFNLEPGNRFGTESSPSAEPFGAGVASEVSGPARRPRRGSQKGGAGRSRSLRWLAIGGGTVLAAVVGVAVVVQTTGDAACAAAAGTTAVRAAGAPAMGAPAMGAPAMGAPAMGAPAMGAPAMGAAAAELRIPAAAPPTGPALHRGKASYYSTSGGGNCSFPKPPADGLFVALSPSEYADAAACGGYLDVTGPKGKVRVLVYDQCPGCAVGHIDLSKKAFSRIADLGDGITSVTYRAVVNPPLSKSLSLRFKDGTSQWWFAVLVADHGNPLRAMEVRSAGRSWKKVKRADYNYWLAEDGLGPGPFDIRLTDVYGQQVTVAKVRLVPDRAQRTGAFLYGHGATRSTPPSPKPTPTAAASPSPSAIGSPSASARPESSPNIVSTSAPTKRDGC